MWRWASIERTTTRCRCTLTNVWDFVVSSSKLSCKMTFLSNNSSSNRCRTQIMRMLITTVMAWAMTRFDFRRPCTSKKISSIKSVKRKTAFMLVSWARKRRKTDSWIGLRSLRQKPRSIPRLLMKQSASRRCFRTKTGRSICSKLSSVRTSKRLWKLIK